jgi:hypothetical protein
MPLRTHVSTLKLTYESRCLCCSLNDSSAVQSNARRPYAKLQVDFYAAASHLAAALPSSAIPTQASRPSQSCLTVEQRPSLRETTSSMPKDRARTITLLCGDEHRRSCRQFLQAALKLARLVNLMYQCSTFIRRTARRKEILQTTTPSRA